MGRLLALFVIVPAVELALLIEVGSRIGTGATLGLIVATGVVGAWLARRQGIGVFQRLQEETRAGRLPADPLVDGAFVLVAGALLMTPGSLTDAIGFLCLVPGVRTLVKRRVRESLERAAREGRLHVHTMDGGGVYGGDPFAPPRQEKVVREVERRDSPAAPEPDPPEPR